MQREFGQAGAALALVALLGGCSWVYPALTTEADTGFGAPYLAPRGNLDPVVLADSPTVRRVGGGEGIRVEEHLQTEPGDIWPKLETPRATLADPEAALRGVPDWRPNEPRSREDLPGERIPGGPLRGPDPRTQNLEPGTQDDEQRQPLRRRGASSRPPAASAQPEPNRAEVLPVPQDATPPLPRRSEGQVVVTPYGPVVTSGGNSRVQSFTAPGGGSGLLTRDGGFTTITPSGGIPQTFPTPR